MVRQARRRGVAVVIGGVGVFVALVTTSRTWVSGTVNDPVLGASTVIGAGSDVARSGVALALAVAAGLVASAAAGKRARVVALVVTGICAVAGLGVVAAVLSDPAAALGPIAAAKAGRSGSLAVDAQVTLWPWLTLLGFALAAVGVIGLARARQSRPGLSSRYDAPGHAPADDWDQLSAGIDPTDVGHP